MKPISCLTVPLLRYSTFLVSGIGGWMHGHIPVAIFSIGASAIVGWPFAGVIGQVC